MDRLSCLTPCVPLLTAATKLCVVSKVLCATAFAFSASQSMSSRAASRERNCMVRTIVASLLF